MKAISHSNRSSSWRHVLLAVGVAAALLVPAMAQDAQAEKTKPAKAEKVKGGKDQGRDGPGSRPLGARRSTSGQVRIRHFRRPQLIPKRLEGLGNYFHVGGAFGAQVTENFWKYVGIRESYAFRENNVTFLSPNQPGLPNYGFGQRLMDWGVNPLFYFTPRGSKWRPFVTVGIAAFDFRPTNAAKDAARSADFAAYGAYTLNGITLPAMTYGGGLKYRINDHWSLEGDALASYSLNPTFGLPPTAALGNVYIPNHQPLFGLLPTAGVNYHWGQKAAWIETPRA